MNVLLIHEHGRAFGSGGVIAMYRLHRALQERGIHSTIACRHKAIEGDDVVELPRAEVCEDLLGSVTWRLGLNDIHCLSTFLIPRFTPFRQADVVNIHGLHTNFFNYLALPKLSRAKPLVVTLHDMWPFTGHCAMSFDCERWKSGCGRCPYLDTFPPVSRDATAVEWRLKRWMYQHAAITVVSPSRWLADLAAKSMLGRFPIHHIPNGIDTVIYKPLDKAACRAALGLPGNKRVIMFAAAALDLPSKGADLLLLALQQLRDQTKSKLVLLLLGDRGEMLSHAARIPAVHLGYVTDDRLKAQAYSAADLFVLPSRAENHSLVLLEALACGTPAVAFRVGGNPEIVRHEQTGLLAEPENPRDLSAAISRLLSDSAFRRTLARNCRATAEKEFSLDLHVEKYANLYAQMIARRAAA